MSTDNNVPSVIVEVKSEFQSVAMPAIVEWETGALKPEKASDLVCSYRLGKVDSLSGREIFIQAENKLFRSQENSTIKNFQTFLAVRNKKTNKIRLILAENLIAKPLVDKSSVDVTETDSISSKFKNVEDLKRAFGSKRSKRYAEQQKKMRENLNQFNESINEAITERQISVEDVNLHTTADLYKDILPPCNREAENVEDVYNLNDLIDESELDDYQELAECVQQSSPEELSENCSRFFRDVFGILAKPVTEKQIKILLYAETLVQLAELKPLTNKGIKQLCPSTRILKKIKDVYTINSQKVLSRIMHDKIICHIFILLLLSCNFKIFYNFLKNCSSIFRNKQSLLRIIGATPFLKNNDTVFNLRLPLPSLPTGQGSMKRQR